MANKDIKKIKVDSRSAGLRADHFLTEHFPKFSRSSLSNLFKDNYVHIDKKPLKAGHKLHLNDVITIDTSLLNSNFGNIDLPILYEDQDLIVIDKPSGVLTHSKGALNTEATVASFIKNKLHDSALQGNRAGIVHRLDRATSGVMICAKNITSLVWLQKQFSTRKTEKTYLAIVKGELEQPEATIDIPLGRNPKKPQTFTVSSSGKPAKTEYKLQEIIKKNSKKYSLIELRPTTGRTHQLRVHMAYVKHPIVGDAVYGRGDGELMLHALSIKLTLSNGKQQSFKAPIPKRIADFKKS